MSVRAAGRRRPARLLREDEGDGVDEVDEGRRSGEAIGLETISGESTITPPPRALVSASTLSVDDEPARAASLFLLTIAAFNNPLNLAAALIAKNAEPR